MTIEQTEATIPNSTQSPPPQAGNVDWADISGWVMKYVFVPMSPFFIGAIIRLVIHAEFSIRVLDPAELAFSLAMLCFLINVSSRNLSEEEYKHTVSGLFTIGAFYFIAMFALSVVQSTELSKTLQSAIDGLIIEAGNSSTISSSIVENYVDRDLVSLIGKRQNILLGIVAIPGMAIIIASTIFRHLYGIGDDE